MEHATESPLLVALKDHGFTEDDVVCTAARKLESILRDSKRKPLLESVPVEMMELFSDRQWPQLIFQFQPSLRLFDATSDVVAYRQQVELVDALSFNKNNRHYYWLVFRQQDEQLVRPVSQQEHQGLKLALQGKNFDAIAAVLWPGEERESRHRLMTELLLTWLKEGLVVDAGEPLPDDARFESEPDAATQSYASSQGPEAENK